MTVARALVAVLGTVVLVAACRSGDAEWPGAGPEPSGDRTGRTGPAGPAGPLDGGVVVNDVPLDPSTVTRLEATLGWSIQDGAYWYDPVLGAVGRQGGPTEGFIPARLGVGGPLAPDASNGTTGVFVNGRELPGQDLRALQDLLGTTIAPGDYFLDDRGNYGYEGGPPAGNLFAEAQQGGYLGETAGGWIGSDGTDSYHFDPESGCSVMSGSGVSC